MSSHYFSWDAAIEYWRDSGSTILIEMGIRTGDQIPENLRETIAKIIGGHEKRGVMPNHKTADFKYCLWLRKELSKTTKIILKADRLLGGSSRPLLGDKSLDQQVAEIVSEAQRSRWLSSNVAVTAETVKADTCLTKLEIEYEGTLSERAHRLAAGVSQKVEN